MAEALAQSTSNPMKRVVGNRDFSLLWTGQATSMLGDQFYAIAGAWLVLNLTGDPLALGMVMALGGIPRVVFTVLGGAITDRVSPRMVMLLSDTLRLGLAGLLTLQVFTGTLQVWMVYIYSLVFGALGGVFQPAAMSMPPHLVPAEDLQAGNSIMQGSTQLIGFLGPALAGGLIAAFPSQNTGVGLAIAFDAFTFVVSVVTLWMMRGGSAKAFPPAAGKTSMFQTIWEGIRFMYKDPVLRLSFVLLAVANFAFAGPFIVGIPYLANIRFAEGAAAFGLVTAGYAGGNLLGIILSGTLPRPGRSAIKILMVVMFAAFAIGTAALGWIDQTWLAMADLFVLGALNGYLAIFLITGVQRNTPREMMGRLMSLMLLMGLIFMPISQAIAGVVLRWNVAALFLGAGGLLAACTIFLLRPEVGNLFTAKFAADEGTGVQIGEKIVG